ncbi:hypothetical protein DBV39_09100 [Orrella marina]|uniref:Uncharacterized protein n=1 Tax=Orrella marina TaxID=2163011 RepID=A0A2R4XJ34_9BURK|nr:hypothetical protein DBV39_09100 [Orrella marina]
MLIPSKVCFAPVECHRGTRPIASDPGTALFWHRTYFGSRVTLATIRSSTDAQGTKKNAGYARTSVQIPSDDKGQACQIAHDRLSIQFDRMPERTILHLCEDH